MPHLHIGVAKCGFTIFGIGVDIYFSASYLPQWQTLANPNFRALLLLQSHLTSNIYNALALIVTKYIMSLSPLNSRIVEIEKVSTAFFLLHHCFDSCLV